MIILSEWIKACTVDQVKEGQLFGFVHDDRKILLANLKGKIHATDLICTHADADLSTGFLSEEGVRCPLHPVGCPDPWRIRTPDSVGWPEP